MTRLRKAANGYDYFSYESEYLRGDWDILPASYGKTRPEKRLRVLENSGADVVKKIHPETLKKRKKAILYCVMIVLAFSMLVAVVYRYAALSEMHIDNVKQQERIDSLSERISSLEVTMNTSRDLNSVMQRASELGMDFAEADNVEYIELNYPAPEYDISE